MMCCVFDRWLHMFCVVLRVVSLLASPLSDIESSPPSPFLRSSHVQPIPSPSTGDGDGDGDVVNIYDVKQVDGDGEVGKTGEAAPVPAPVQAPASASASAPSAAPAPAPASTGAPPSSDTDINEHVTEPRVEMETEMTTGTETADLAPTTTESTQSTPAVMVDTAVVAVDTQLIITSTPQASLQF